MFLAKYAPSTYLKLQSVFADVSDDTLLSLLAAIRLLHTYMTKPYWTLVNSNIQYVDFHVYVQLMAQNLYSWCQDPQRFCVTGLFKNFLAHIQVTYA